MGEHQKLRDVLEADSMIEARIMLAGIYFQDEQLLLVRQQMLAIADEDPSGEFYFTDSFLQLMEVLVELAESNTELSAADKQEVGILLQLAETGFLRAGVVLEPISKRIYQPIYPLVSNNPAARYRPAKQLQPRSKPKAKQTAKETAVLKAYPNPTAGNYTVNYSLPAGSDDAVLYVYNMQGRLVGQHKLNSTSGYLELNAAGLPAGLYLLQASCKGQKVASYKLTVQ